MHETPSAVLSAWSNFYVITGTSAASLTGLMFVVITLVAGRRETSDEGVATYSTPTVMHFGAALLTSALLNIPWHGFVAAAIVIGLAAATGTGYAVLILMRARSSSAYEPGFDDWIWYAILPLAVYLAGLAAAVALLFVPAQALFAFAGVVIMLIVVGIRNAWDVVTYIAVGQAGAPDGAAGAPDGEAGAPGSKGVE